MTVSLTPSWYIVLSVDIMDDSGQHLSGFTHDVYKVRLDLSGNQIESEKAHSKLDDTAASICYFRFTVVISNPALQHL